MTKEEAYVKLTRVHNFLVDKYYKENPDKNELPLYLWHLYDVVAYYFEKRFPRKKLMELWAISNKCNPYTD